MELPAETASTGSRLKPKTSDLEFTRKGEAASVIATAVAVVVMSRFMAVPSEKVAGHKGAA